jgi:6-phosphogluconolactonase (cycloisomerase 2 family)
MSNCCDREFFSERGIIELHSGISNTQDGSRQVFQAGPDSNSTKKDGQTMLYTKWIRSLVLRCFVAIAGLGLLLAAAPRAGLARDLPGAVYVLSNQSPENSVLVYGRASDGTLTFSGSFPTGGSGAGTGGDPLGSQGSLVLGSGHRLLFAVNAGSNEVSMFAVRGTGLVLLDKEPSGGQMPVSIAVNGFLAYVLNAGGTPNISGFIIDPFRDRLIPLRGSQRPLAGGSSASPAQVSFNNDGNVLIVTEKGTQTIDTYRMNFQGYASQPISHASSGVTPFGFSVINRGFAIVSEAGSGSASSYQVHEDGGLNLVSGSVAIGQNAPCWLVTTNDGRYAYTANAGSQSIGSFSIAPDGVLNLLNPRAAVTTGGPLDMGMSINSKYLYVREGTGMLARFRVEQDGSLTAVGSVTGLPAGAQGIAVR